MRKSKEDIDADYKKDDPENLRCTVFSERGYAESSPTVIAENAGCNEGSYLLAFQRQK